MATATASLSSLASSCAGGESGTAGLQRAHPGKKEGKKKKKKKNRKARGPSIPRPTTTKERTALWNQRIPIRRTHTHPPTPPPYTPRGLKRPAASVISSFSFGCAANVRKPRDLVLRGHPGRPLKPLHHQRAGGGAGIHRADMFSDRTSTLVLRGFCQGGKSVLTCFHFEGVHFEIYPCLYSPRRTFRRRARNAKLVKARGVHDYRLLSALCVSLFEHCPLLKKWEHEHEKAFETFIKYKVRVPVCGAIMLNTDLDKCVLVKGWSAKSSWSFPKGKINKDELQFNCAAREVCAFADYLGWKEQCRISMGISLKLLLFSALVVD
ncbi:MAG: hypothetical protein BJ554DRAFT_5188 [Olpidium bornovanus]|uniref:Nudix hydrolase domain-containing protein n=1 Tax=Olpidium bornovanus TaxID=278681 RepID=A0A8H8DEY5_9FUNG|nr:MAG: hypothetical protein BJ554DRAFT_5188 [Olpidium bornovanus]